MRTTLTIEDHLMKELKELAHRSGRPLKQVVNETLRNGLACRCPPASSRPYRSKTYSMGFPPKMNLDKALEVAASLEDDEVARKMALKK